MATTNFFALLADDYTEAPVVAPVVAAAPKATQQKSASKPDQKKTARTSDNRNKNQVPKKGEFMGKPERDESQKTEVKKGYTKPAHGRAYDRKSQSGFNKGGEKKEVAGAGSWGEEVSAQIEASENVGAENVEEEVVVVEKEPEDEYKSFADFQKEREALKLAPVVQTRAANDGVVDPKWKKMTMVTKDDEVLYAGKAAKEVKKKDVKVKQTLAIEQTFAPRPRENRDSAKGPKGGRGGQRDNKDASRGNDKGGRSGQRGDRASSGKDRAQNAKIAVNVNDQKAFPSLA